MSEGKPQGVAGAVSGWIKALVTSVVGLVSGAVIMYLTPVVNNAIKPAKPVANFATQAAGLTVNFNNRTTGGVQGWWDFGDGSALEPFDPKLDNVKHAYPKPGTYSVKLTLANLIGEESDRSASVVVDTDAPAAGPTIDSFDLTPVDKRQRAPANYQLTSKVNNASFCILSYGDARPIEIVDVAAVQKCVMTFEQAGEYTVRLVAVNGKQLIERSKTVKVVGGDAGSPIAKLLVTYDAVRVERLDAAPRIHCGWQADTTASVSAFRKAWADPSCYKIARAQLANKDETNDSVRNVKLEIAPDQSKVIVSGELVRDTGVFAKGGRPPHWLAELKVSLERRSTPQAINRGHIAMAVDLNTTTRIPIQPLEAGYEVVGKKIILQLWDGKRKAWEGSAAVTNAQVTLNNKTCLVTVAPQDDCIMVTIVPPGPVIQPVGFRTNPLLLPRRPQ